MACFKEAQLSAFYKGKSRKIAENINQDYAEEWNSHIQGILSIAKECFNRGGRDESSSMET